MIFAAFWWFKRSIRSAIKDEIATLQKEAKFITIHISIDERTTDGENINKKE
jgi:hypothetical protein